MRELGKTLSSKGTGKIINGSAGIIFLCFLFITLSITDFYAQPNPVTVETRDLYQHGTNASGTDGDESIDSVSLGSTTYYFYMPDTATNDGFDYGNLFTNVTDTFVWTVTPGLSAGATSVAGYASSSHYKQINWSGTGTGNIQVNIETDGGCTNSYNAQVEVIALPTVQFSSTGSSYCAAAGTTDGSVGYSLINIPVSFTSVVKGNKNLMVDVTVSCSNPGFGATQAHNNITVTETGAGTATFNLPVTLNYFGNYTITLTAINDRISTKCDMNGTVGALASYNFILNKVPSSGAVYHAPNEP